MVAGHLQSKNGYRYMVLCYPGEDHKSKSKWRATHLKEKGNKKQAEKMLSDWRREFTADQQLRNRAKGIYFDVYLERWLKQIEPLIAPSTYSAYKYNVKSALSPYFKPMNLLLSDVEPRHISEFYHLSLNRGLSPSSVHRFHANIHKALSQAVTEGLLPSNPADRVKPPRNNDFTASFYSADECRQLLDAVTKTPIEVPIALTLLLGLRRSETIGLKWDAVDFDNHIIHVRHSVHQINGEIVTRDILKRKSSHRTLPMPQMIETLLQSIPNKTGYICVDRNGELIKPKSLSKQFKDTLKCHHLRDIRFHDLRHTCASLLLTAQTPLIDVSHWLGHSTIAITADLYGHLEFSSKLQCASVLSDALEAKGEQNDTI